MGRLVEAGGFSEAYCTMAGFRLAGCTLTECTVTECTMAVYTQAVCTAVGLSHTLRALAPSCLQSADQCVHMVVIWLVEQKVFD